MNPIDPNTVPGGMEPNGNPKPWQKDQPQQAADGTAGADDGGIADAAEVVGGIAEAAGSVLEGASGCADGCGSCSLAVLIGLFLTAQAAFAVFR